MKVRHKDTGEIIQLAEEGVISSDGRRFCWYQVELLPEPIDEVQPSLPDNLDGAAEEQARSFGYMKEDYEYKELIETFKAGAEWMAEQGETQEHFVIGSIAGSPCGPAVVCYTDEFEIGDEVIVQIRKK